jgi:hypothetical protein
MSTSLVDADSVLAIDIGSITTRLALFDVVDNRYRFLASGSAPSTVNSPFNDISEGIRLAIDRLQAVTGRTLIGTDERLIIPASPDGSGVDIVAATISAGPPLRVVIMGLLEDISLESARRLVTTTYAKIVDTISLSDRRRIEERLDAIVRLRPDLVLVTGGTEGGASQSVLKLLEAVGLAAHLMPDGHRPDVLFAGNQSLRDEVKATFDKRAPLHFAANVRPALEFEQLEAAQYQLARITGYVRSRQIPGVKELDNWSGGGLLPTSMALGRIIRFLSKVYNSTKGVLGIDIGSSATSLAAAFDGELVSRVYPQLGIGHGLKDFLEICPLDDITRWLHLDVSNDYARQYVYNKTLYPASVPATPEDLAVEGALARQAMQIALKKSAPSFPEKTMRYGPDLSPWFEPVIAMGSVLTRLPNLPQATLMLLDGLQPTGVTTLVLDQNHLAPSLGVIAAINPLLVVQVLESNTFLTLGTVISPIGEARPGAPVLRLRMAYAGGGETSLDVKQGTVELLQLPMGQSAEIHLQPLHRFDVGMGGPGRGGRLRVIGGALGVIVDARGRPLRLTGDPARRRELINKWRWMVGC